MDFRVEDSSLIFGTRQIRVFLKNVIKTNAHKSDIKLEAQPTEPVSLT
jgi:hypothetical protein